jgi:hypothetical protein
MSPCFICGLKEVLYEFYDHSGCTATAITDAGSTALSAILLQDIQ